MSKIYKQILNEKSKVRKRYTPLLVSKTPKKPSKKVVEFQTPAFIFEKHTTISKE